MFGAPGDIRLISAGQKTVSADEKALWLLGGGNREVTLSFLQQDQQAPLVADLYLSGGKLGEPLAKGIPFKEAAGEKHPSLREGSFSLELPKLEKSVRMLLIVRAMAKDSDKGLEIASIPIVACPDTSLVQIARRFADDNASGHSLSLFVFGEVKGLRELLRMKQIPFEDLGKDFPLKLPRGTVAVGDLSKDLSIPSLYMEPGSSLMVFHEDTTAPEDITLTSQDRRIQVVIHHASPASWAEDAKAQNLFFDIIQKTPTIP